jgi:hypothetical protein
MDDILGIDGKPNPLPVMIGRCSIIVLSGLSGQLMPYRFHLAALFRAENDQKRKTIPLRNQGAKGFPLLIPEGPPVLFPAE